MIKTSLEIMTNFKNNRLRNNLTILGIAIGATCICLVLGLFNGFNQLTNQPKINYRPQTLVLRSLTNQSGNLIGLNTDLWNDYNSIKDTDSGVIQTVKGVKSATTIATALANLETTKTFNDQMILATSPTLVDSLPFTIKNGQFLHQDLIQNGLILGQSLAKKIFDTDNVIGKIIKINNYSFTVLGVIKDENNPYFNLNETAIINITVAQQIFGNTLDFKQININLKPDANLNQVKKNINQKLSQHHGDSQDFQIINPRSESIAMTENYRLLTNLILIMAVIALTISGIGLMNIAFVNVAERTREIGVRKAVGAKNHHILGYFLIESSMLSLWGGLLACLISFAIQFGLQFIVFVPIRLTLMICAETLLITLIIGLLAGLLPALRATGKNPINILR